MTDLKKTIELYKGFDIDCKVNNTKEGFEITLGGWEDESTYSDKFDGYSGFYSTLFFHENEKFTKQGFWEQHYLYTVLVNRFNVC